MTLPDRDYDDILSRVLHSAMDPIEPTGDGLAKIQRRIAEPWLRRHMSLLRHELTALRWLIAVRCEPFFSGARSGLAKLTAGSRGRLRSALRVAGAAAAQDSSGRSEDAAGQDGLTDVARRSWLGPTIAWLRPALAVAGAVVIVVVGVFALGQIRQTLVNPTGSGGPGPGAGVSTTGQPAANGFGPAPGQGSQHTAGSSSTHKQTGKPADKRGASPSPCASSPPPTPTPTTTSPTPTPTTTSPTPTPTTTSPTPTPTTTATSGPVASSAGVPGDSGAGVPDDFSAVAMGGGHAAVGQVNLGSCPTPAATITSGGPGQTPTTPAGPAG